MPKKGYEKIKEIGDSLLKSFLDRTGNHAAVNIFLESKENYQRRNDTNYDSRKDDLPLCTVWSDKAVKSCGNYVVVLHIKVCSIKVVIYVYEFDDKHSCDSRLQQRKNDAEIYPGVRCAVNDSAFVQRYGDLAEELHENVDRDDVCSDVKDYRRRNGVVKSQLIDDLEYSYLHRDIGQQHCKHEECLYCFCEHGAETLDNKCCHCSRNDSSEAGEHNDYRRVFKSHKDISFDERLFVIFPVKLGRKSKHCGFRKFLMTFQ